MKSSWLTCACLLAGATFNGQVYIEHNLPAEMKTGDDRVVEIIVHKPSSKEFAEYSLEFGPGLLAREVASSGGSFFAAEGYARIIWPLAAATPEVRIRMSITAAVSGSYTLKQKYTYDINGARKIVLLEDVPMRVSASVETSNQEGFRTASEVIPKNLPISRVDSLEMKLRDPAQAATHVAQLRKDAYEARKLGDNELKEADLEIKESKLAIAQAQKNNDEQVKKQLITEAESRLRKAELNKQIALKILALAASLEHNANDIEKAAAAKRQGDSLASIGSAQDAKRSSEDMAHLKQLFTDKGSDGVVAAQDGDTLYHIQLGAFGQAPSKNAYKKAGKVQIINENGLYKVLAGGFRDRSEAEKRRGELNAAGLQGFIVRYVGNRRVN